MAGNSEKSAATMAKKIKRIVKRRKRQCASLASDTVAEIAAKCHEFMPDISLPEKVKEPQEKVEWILSHYLRISSNESLNPTTRRNALQFSRKMLSMIDAFYEERETAAGSGSQQQINGINNRTPHVENMEKKLSESHEKESRKGSRNNGTISAEDKEKIVNGKKNSTNASTQPESRNLDKRKQKITSSIPPNETNSTNSTVTESQETVQRANSNGKNAAWTSQPLQSGQENPSRAARITPANSVEVPSNTHKRTSQELTNGQLTTSKPPASAQFTAPPQSKNFSNENSAPKPDPKTQSATSSGESVRNRSSKTSAIIKGQKQKTSAEKLGRMEEWRIRKKQEREAEIASILKAGEQTNPSKKTLLHFPADSSPTKSCSQITRVEKSVRFTPQLLNEVQAEDLSERLSKWEPYWKVAQYVSCGVTSIGEDSKTRNSSQMVASCRFALKPEQIKDMKRTDWGIRPVSKNYIDNQMRMIILMLPMTPNKKYPRADTHFWPKGSFIVVNKSVVGVDQRKQQSHDHSKWSGLCRPLDLTQHIQNPTDYNEVKLLTYDVQQFYYCIALCRYVSPASLFQTMINPPPTMQPIMKKLSREEGLRKALSYTKQQTVALDDEENDQPDDSLGKFVFTLTCPFTRSPLNRPVRGENCRHFQVSFFRFIF